MTPFTQLKLVASILAFATISPLLAEDTPKKESAKPEAAKKHVRHTHLGVLVSSAHPALASNLGELLSPEQGLIVEELLENSPAAKAGIKVYDILTTYDDQKLFSAEQLAKLVHADQPGREVSLGYLRAGQLQKVQVTLGEARALRHRARIHSPGDTVSSQGALRRVLDRLRDRLAPRAEWKYFDSLTLKKLSEDQFRAEVYHLDKSKKPQKHVFEGTREEIKEAIEADRDLGVAERNHLLRSLDLQKSADELLLDPDWFDDSSEPSL